MDYTKLSVKQILSLIGIIEESTLKEVQHIKDNYEQYSENYKDTIAFLVDIGIAKFNGRIINLSWHYKTTFGGEKVSDEKKDQTKKIILESMAKTRNRVNEEFRSYLKNFQYSGAIYQWRPNLSQRLRFSGIRNLLMDLGIVLYSESEDSYYISSNYDKYIIGCIGYKPITPKEAARVRNDDEALGSAAEHEVLDYESRRLAIYKLPGPIKWVAQENVACGYDILSYTVGEDGKTIAERYIEVKAVSRGGHRFFWTRNEMDTAKTYGGSYFLYLVPVIRKDCFDLDSMLILGDPYASVYLNQTSWKRHEEVVMFYKSGEDIAK